MPETNEFQDHITKMREAMETIDPGTNFPEGYFGGTDPYDPDHSGSGSAAVVMTPSGSKLVVPGLDISKDSLSPEDLDMIYEQENLQFLMDHHLFYWKMDRYMLSVDQRPLPAQIAQDRYLAHGARQNLLELWKKKELKA
jgi:hypothetical protein